MGATQDQNRDENKQIMRRFIEQLDARNVAIYDELIADDAVVHLPGGVSQKREEAIEKEEAWYAAFPDTRHTIDDLLAEDDKVVLRGTVRGTHQAPYLGIAPTNRKVTFTEVLIYRIRDGQIAEIWIEADLTDLVRKLEAP